MKVLLYALLIVSTALAQTPAKTAPQQGAPPKNLAQRADGHFSANQDPSNPGEFEVHVVKPGETLSGIAGVVLKNPRLWPQLWEQNEHIVNPHWIYPDDRILVRPVTPITEVALPEPAPLPAPSRRAGDAAQAPQPAAESVPPAPENLSAADQSKPVPEVKIDDLYCSGFVRKAAVPKKLTVLAKFDGSGGVMAVETDYIYISQGSEDGIASGSLYQVIRPTTRITDPKGRTSNQRNLGMHYLEIAQIRVALTQADFSLARVIHSCGDAIEPGDMIVPFEPIALPPRARLRPFSETMPSTGGIAGAIVSTKNVLVNAGSTDKLSGAIPGVPGGRLGPLERGVASDGAIVYIDIGKDNLVKPGDIFIVFRTLQFDERLHQLTKEARDKLKGVRTAIGELVVLKVEERASTALVTYATDALSLGDSVERR